MDIVYIVKSLWFEMLVVIYKILQKKRKEEENMDFLTFFTSCRVARKLVEIFYF